MFVIRRITSDSNELYQVIGDHFNLILKERNPEEFKATTNVLKWNKDSVQDIYGFVIHNNGSEIYPLYFKSHYEVYLSDGNMFKVI